ncbi:MAG: hypothetical protein P4L22_03610 [Candidatus Babeliales bacterium]|nr:hypothetical protein [Candidatus Babeliales bacterium]
MTRKNPGFYLTEVIIYIALSSMFFILLFQFSNQMYKKYKSISSNLNSQSWSVIDLIARDLQKTNTIKLIDKNIIVISIFNKDIGWNLIKNKLYRIEGEFNKENNKWENQIKSLVHYNTLSCEFKNQGQSIKINLEIQNGTKIYKINKHVFIRNREL